MKHLKRVAGIAIACSALSGPALAVGHSPDASFEDLLGDFVEKRGELAASTWRDSSDAAPWIRSAQPPGIDYEALFGRSRFEWKHRELDDWPESLRRWGFDNDGHWQGHGALEPFCLPAVPEPSAVALMAAGLLALGLTRRRRR